MTSRITAKLQSVVRKVWRRPGPLVVGALGLLALGVVVLGLPDVLYPGGGQPRATVQAGLLAVAAATVAFTGVRITVAETRRANDRTHVRDLYGQAIDQIGSEKLDVRLGGIYALARLAKDSREDQPPIVEVLSALVREHSTDPALRPAPQNEKGHKSAPSARRAADIRAAVTVLASLPILENAPRAVLTGADLTGHASLSDLRLPPTANLANVDLTGADLSGAGLSGVNLTGAVLSRANLTSASLSGANLTGVYAELTHLTDAHLDGANLTGAVLGGATLIRTNLIRATLADASLGGANLTGANLDDADLSDASMGWATLTFAVLARANVCGTDMAGVELRQDQVDSAFGDDRTVILEGLVRPPSWANNSRPRPRPVTLG